MKIVVNVNDKNRICRLSILGNEHYWWQLGFLWWNFLMTTIMFFRIYISVIAVFKVNGVLSLPQSYLTTASRGPVNSWRNTDEGRSNHVTLLKSNLLTHHLCISDDRKQIFLGNNCIELAAFDVFLLIAKTLRSKSKSLCLQDGV